jgi:hypothetical protein
VQFLWSDAWILQAVALASKDEPASLASVLAAADALNHALPIPDELHGAFARLIEEGYVVERAAQFSLGMKVPQFDRSAMVGANARDGRNAAAKLLDAEPWTHETNVRDPRNAVKCPGLTDERLQAAEKEYRRRGAR